MSIALPELKSSNNEIRSLNSYLLKVLGYEFSNIVSPCYFPIMVKYWNDLKSYSGIDESDLRAFIKILRDSTRSEHGDVVKQSDLAIISDKITCLLTMSIIYYARIRKFDTVKILMYVLAIRFYSNVIHKMFKFCKSDIWEEALQKISQKHLFKTNNGIQNTLVYLSNTLFDKHINMLLNYDSSPKQIIDYVYELRQRISQSFRSFAVKYYELEKISTEHKKQGTEYLQAGEESSLQSNINILSQKFAESICTYGQIDKIAYIKAIDRSKINRDVALSLIGDLSIVNNREDVRFVYILMNKILPINQWCIKEKQIYLCKKIILDTKNIDKYSVKATIEKLYSGFENYYKFKTVNKNQIILFLLNYLILFAVHKYC